jgi:hypothetical protein
MADLIIKIVHASHPQLESSERHSQYGSPTTGGGRMGTSDGSSGQKPSGNQFSGQSGGGALHNTTRVEVDDSNDALEIEMYANAIKKTHRHRGCQQRWRRHR